MGIKGLTRFIDQHPELLTDHQLRDTKVVIDGNNLFFFLHQYYHVPFAYGGDYDQYADAVRSYFETLLSVGIEPFVIFDGCYEPDDRKLSTVLSRMTKNIRSNSQMSRHGGYPGCGLLPILAADVFRQVLAYLSIQYVMTDLEADGQVAALANLWHCPVMSNDSDFFIFPLTGGFILFDYLNLQVKSGIDENGKDYKYLHSQIYYLQSLLKGYKNLHTSDIPLFATLMGTDFVSASHFDKFFRKANISKGRDDSNPKRHLKMGLLLEWMDRCRGDLIEEVLETIEPGKRNKVKQMIAMSVDSYNTKLISNIGVATIHTEEGATECALRTYSGKQLPDYLVKPARRAKISTSLLNALTLRRVILVCQAELPSLPSAMDCAGQLRQIAYGIILSIDNDPDATITEYSRRNNDLVKTEIPPLGILPETDITVPDLEAVTSMSVENKLVFFFKCLDVSYCSSNSQTFQVDFVICLMRYYATHASPPTTRTYLYCLILSYINLSIVSQKVLSVGEITFEGLTLLKAEERLKKYSQAPRHNHAHRYDGGVVHLLSQFQGCWWSALQIFQLLMLPVLPPYPSSTINGSFIYNLFTDMKGRADPLAFIGELLGRDSSLHKYFTTLCNCVLENLAEEHFQTVALRRSKTKATKKSKNRPPGTQSSASTVSFEPVLDIEANCALDNRFSAFMLDDCS